LRPSQYECIDNHHDSKAANYWICAYANNQWDLSSALTSDPGQTSFYRAIALSKGTVTVLDHRATTLKRIWCAFEIYNPLPSDCPVPTWRGGVAW
jgi:hypothetical protein